jgi:hypothetical protein
MLTWPVLSLLAPATNWPSLDATETKAVGRLSVSFPWLFQLLPFWGLLVDGLGTELYLSYVGLLPMASLLSHFATYSLSDL